MIGFGNQDTETIPTGTDVTILFFEVVESSLAVGETPALENLTLQSPQNSGLFATVVLGQGMCIRHLTLSSGAFTVAVCMCAHLSSYQRNKPKKKKEEGTNVFPLVYLFILCSAIFQIFF